MIAELITLLGSEQGMRHYWIHYAKLALNEYQQAQGLPEFDFAFANVPDSLLETNPDTYFTRLLELYYNTKSYDYIVDLYEH